MNDTQIKGSRINFGLGLVRKIVTLYKKGSFGTPLTPLYGLIQEVNTMFRSVHDVIECFLQADQYLMITFASSTSEGAKSSVELYVSLHLETKHDSTSYYPYVDVIN